MVSKITKEKKNFEERKTTVFKKAKELSTLCDVDLLLILYGSDQPHVPEVYCSKPDCANDIITKYYSGNSKKQELKHIIDNNEFIKDLGIDDLTKLDRVLAGKIEIVNERIDLMKRADLGSDCFRNQMLFFGGYEGQVEDMDVRVDQIEDDVELQELLMQFDVDDFGFEDFNAELLTTV